jgi:hypothetical protein
MDHHPRLELFGRCGRRCNYSSIDERQHRLREPRHCSDTAIKPQTTTVEARSQKSRRGRSPTTTRPTKLKDERGRHGSVRVRTPVGVHRNVRRGMARHLTRGGGGVWPEKDLRHEDSGIDRGRKRRLAHFTNNDTLGKYHILTAEHGGKCNPRFTCLLGLPALRASRQAASVTSSRR